MILKLVDDKVRECAKESCTARKVDFDSSAATTEANRPYLSVVYKAPAPIVATEAASPVTESGATLKGQANPHGYATTYQFEYGTTTSYGTKVPVTAESVGSGNVNVAVSKAITGLKGNAFYHYRISATNAYGTTVGAGATVGPGAVVERSVLFDGASVGARAQVRASVIGRDAVIGDGVILDGVVIGDGARVEAGNELRAGVRVFPGAVLGLGAVRFSSDRS